MEESETIWGVHIFCWVFFCFLKSSLETKNYALLYIAKHGKIVVPYKERICKSPTCSFSAHNFLLS